MKTDYQRGYEQGRFSAEMDMLNKAKPDADIKKWFEENYLDGDKVQDGWMLSSCECLDALTTFATKHQEELEDAYKRGKQCFLKDIRKISATERGNNVSYIIFDEVGEVDWEKLSEAPTKDKQ